MDGLEEPRRRLETSGRRSALAASPNLPRRQLSNDGLEYTFALNHLAYFVLTGELRARLIAAAPSRIAIPPLARIKARASTSTICSPRKATAP